MSEMPAFATMKDRLFNLLDRYPEEMREIVLTGEDQANVSAVAFFVQEVAHLPDMKGLEKAEVILAYIETIWMAGFEAGRTRNARL
jgi:hypothetical protein